VAENTTASNEKPAQSRSIHHAIRHLCGVEPNYLVMESVEGTPLKAPPLIEFLQ
jgi:hypothetical protein